MNTQIWNNQTMYDCLSSVEQKKIFGEMCLSVFSLHTIEAKTFGSPNSSKIENKILDMLHSTEERKSYRFGMTWG